MIRPASVGLVVLMLLLCGYGQGTEQFIPIGQSPGISGTSESVFGTIAKADPRTMIVCIQQPLAQHELYCVNYSHAMAIYLDRSHLKQPNRVGRWDDVRRGRTVEVYPGHWMKIRVDD